MIHREPDYTYRRGDEATICYWFFEMKYLVISSNDFCTLYREADHTLMYDSQFRVGPKVQYAYDCWLAERELLSD